MANGFNLTAELSIREQITGLAAAKRKIQREVGKFNVKLQIDASRIQAQLRALNGTLTTTKNLASDVQKSFSQIRSPNIRVTQIQKITTELKTLNGTAQQVDRSFAASSKRIAQFSAVVGGLYLASRRLREGFQSAVEYQSQLVKIGQITNSSLPAVTKLGQSIRTVGVNFGVAGDSLASVTATLSSASFTLKEIEQLLPTIAQAAQSPSFGNLESLSDGIIVLKKFTKETEDYGKALNQVNQLSNDYAVEAESLVAILKRAGSTYRQSSDDLAGLFAISTAAKASTRLGDGTIGTGLKSIFQSLQSDRANSVVESLGGSLRNSDGSNLSPLDSIRELARLNAQLSQTQKGADDFGRAISEIAGGFQQSKLLAVIQNIELVEKAYRTASEESDSLARNSRLQFQSIESQLTRTKESFASFFDTVINSGGFQSSVSTTLELVRGLTEASKALLPLTPVLLAVLAGKGISRGISAGSSFVGGLNNTTPQGSRIGNFLGANSQVSNPRTQLLQLYRDELRIKRANLTEIERENIARRLVQRSLRENSTVLTANGRITQVTSGLGATGGGFLRNRAGNFSGNAKALGGIALAGGIAAVGAGALGDTASAGLTGALTGGALGASVAGPFGAAIGGAIGGLLALRNAATAAAKAETEKTRDRLFSAGFSADNTREVANSFIRERLTGSRFLRAFRSQDDQDKLIKDFQLGKADRIKPFADAQKQAIEQDIQSGALKSFADVRKKYGEFSVISDIADNGLRDMSAGLDDFVNKLLYQASKVEESIQIIQKVDSGTQFEAFNSRQRARNISDALPDRLSNIKNPLVEDFRGLEDVGSKRFFSDIGKIGYVQNSSIAQIGKATNTLQEVLSRGGATKEGVTSALTGAGVSGGVVARISQELEKMNVKEFNDALSDVPALTNKLTSSFSGLVEGVRAEANATKEMRQRIVENNQALFAQRESFRSASLNVATARLDLADERQRFKGGRLDTNAGERVLIDNVGGTAAQLTAELQRIQEEFKRFGDARLSVQAQDVANRLGQLADSSLRLKNIQEEQTKVQASLAGREGFLANFFTSDSEGRAQLDRDLQAAKEAQRGGLNALSTERQQGAVRFLQGISDVSDFNGSGKTGGELLSELLRNARPEFFKADINRNNELQAVKETRLADSIAARQALADFERQNLEVFSSQMSRFETALKEFNIPESISIGGNFKHEIVINGGEVWKGLEPMIVQKVNESVAKALPQQPIDGPSAGRGQRVNGYYSNGKGF